MKTILKSIFAFIILAVGMTTVQAQDEINRVEGFVGFSHNRLDTGLSSDDFDDFDDRVGANGFNGSITGNFSKYVGAKFDFSVHGKNEDFNIGADRIETRYRIYNYLGGIQFKNNLKEGPRVKPFAHILAGVARQTVNVNSPALSTVFTSDSFKTSSTNFALAVGGGLDIRATKNVDIRVFQFDYNPTYVKDRDFDGFTLDGRAQHNYRFGFGIVFH